MVRQSVFTDGSRAIAIEDVSTARPSDARIKASIVADTLRARIVEGRLPPSARLKLRQLADEFQCSEIPIREAMHRLEAERLIVLVPHGGARVAQVSREDIVHLTEARALMEPEATVQAASAIDDAGIERLRAMLDEMSTLVASNDLDAYSQLNRRFHGAILAFCPNPHLVRMIETLWDKAEWGRIVHKVDPGHGRQSLQQHEAIVDAIAARDLDRVRAVSELHSRFGLESLRRIMAPNGG